MYRIAIRYQVIMYYVECRHKFLRMKNLFFVFNYIYLTIADTQSIQ